MRYQERIYIQNENRAVRNKRMTNVNMSSDFAIFTSPTFNVSGATKVQCDSVDCYLTGYSLTNILSAATDYCYGTGSTNCFTTSTWETKIYEDDVLKQTDVFYTSTILSGYPPSDTFFTSSVEKCFNNLGYDYTYNQSTSAFTINKPFGVKILEVDLCISFDYVPTYACPAGYTATPANDACQKIITTGTTFKGNGAPINPGNVNGAYAVYGCSFYPKLQNENQLPFYYSGASSGSAIGKLLDATGGTIQPMLTIATGSTFWANPSANNTDGRLNKIGLSADTGEWLGFSKCIDITESGTYYIGIAADNDCRFKIDSVLFASFSGNVVDNFRKWSVFEVELTSGIHIIEMEGLDKGPAASSFGAEVYKPVSFSALTAATTTGDTGLIFSTSEYRSGVNYWQLGETLGYSCSSGYSLNTCSLPYTCNKIVTTSFTETCTASCLDNCVVVCEENFPYIDKDSEGVHIIDPTTTTSIPITFNFTGNTDVFTATSASFKYSIYKYNTGLGIFTVPSVYNSEAISYSAFSGTNILQQSVPISALTFDNQYVVKGFYEFIATTDYLNRLGKKIDTSIYAQYGDYQLYNPHLDYYIVGVTKAESPTFVNTSLTSLTYSNNTTLQQQVIFVDDYLEYLTLHTTSPSTTDYGPNNATGSTYFRTGSVFVLQNTYRGDVFVTLNGLTLAKGIDYTLSGQTLTMLGPITNGDIITIVYTRDGGTTTLISEAVEIDSSIPSGPTNGQSNNKYYYNTTTGKYEIYTNNEPLPASNIMIILNGITLLRDIDYYQSTTNKNRIILNGTIVTGDIVNIIYYPRATMINGITEANTYIRWVIKTPPQDVNGQFVVQYGTDPTFTTYSVNSIVPYVAGNTAYDTILNLTGSVGTNVFYRIKNEKNYVSMCGDKIGSTAYSETVKAIIQSNAINSY